MPDTTFQLLSDADIREIVGPAGSIGVARAVEAAVLAKQREMDAKAEPASDLAQRCREIIKWQDTGILKGKALREFASKQRWADDVHALTTAERVTAREAFDFIAAHPPAAQDREPMTDEDIERGRPELCEPSSFRAGIRYAERAHGIGTAKPAQPEGGVFAVLSDLLDEFDRNTCTHESTHRGGAIWTICDDCGAKWADDRGGFVPYSDPPAVAAARALLAAQPAQGVGE